MPVEFSTYVAKNTTRATNLTASNLKNFGVIAYQNKDDVTAKSLGDVTANFMYNQLVTGGNSASDWNSWTYSPVKYWPNAEKEEKNKISFVAYTPFPGKYDGNSATEGSAENGLSLVKSTGTDAHTVETADVPWMKYDYDGATLKVDFMYAQEVNKTKANNGKLQTTGTDYSDGTSDDNHVLLTFHHALARIGDPSRIDVKYRADEANTVVDGSAQDVKTGTTVTLHKVVITVKGAAGKVGFFDLDAQTWQEISGSSTYYGATDKVGEVTFGADKGASGDLNITVGKTADSKSLLDHVTTLVGNIMAIPAKSDDKLTIEAEVTYTVSTKDVAHFGTDKSVDVTNVCKNTSEVKLSQGQDLAIHLVLGLTSVKFEISVDNWETSSGGSAIETEIDLPKNEE